MAETFLAVRRGPAGFEQRVCVKRILPAYEADQSFVESFLAEARTSAALRHANIVQVVDFGFAEQEGSHYLALELVDGLDLRALAERGARFDPALITLIASDLAAALEHAHCPDEGRAKVVHRDVSPSNVLVSRAGEVKLTDFGIARVIGGARRTSTGVIKGKVPYMPPEYIEHGRFDERGDLFALGVMLFELANGQRPFDGASDIETLRRIVSGERRPFRVEAPPVLVSFVERLIAARPEDRFPSARALLDALPSIPVNQTRRRLAELVRARSTAFPLDSLRPTELAPRGRSGSPPIERPEHVNVELTRTAPRPATKRPSRAPVIALVAAAVCMFAVAIAGLARLDPELLDAGRLLDPRRALGPTGDPRAELARERVGEEAGSAGGDLLTGKPVSTPATLHPARTETALSESGAGELPADDAPRGEVAGRAPTSGGSSVSNQPVLTESVSVQPVLPESVSGRSRRGERGSHHQAAELRVVVYPFGDIWIDDKYMGQSPLSTRLPAGSHTIAVGEGRAREQRSIHLEAGERERLVFQLPQTPREN